uniref:Uncharacterized protein n=1 Tax=Triticum urartu TaxID=4572 RepID=A0A8R7QZ11_TRIUA
MGMGAAAAGLLPREEQWSTLEDQRGECPLLSSAWSLPGPPGEGIGNAKQGALRRAAARAWGALAAGPAEMSALALSDPRKPVFAAKVALAIALMSLLAFVREPRDFVSHSVWALLTAVVVFEFSIGTHVPIRPPPPSDSVLCSDLIHLSSLSSTFPFQASTSVVMKWTRGAW